MQLCILNVNTYHFNVDINLVSISLDNRLASDSANNMRAASRENLSSWFPVRYDTNRAGF